MVKLSPATVLDRSKRSERRTSLEQGPFRLSAATTAIQRKDGPVAPLPLEKDRFFLSSSEEPILGVNVSQFPCACRGPLSETRTLGRWETTPNQSLVDRRSLGTSCTLPSKG